MEEAITGSPLRHEYRDDSVRQRHETRDMPLDPDSPSVVGRRMRARREALGWSQEKLGVLIGLDESSSRARISRYELGVHEPPVATARLIADALKVPLPFLYCDDEDVAALLVALYEASRSVRREKAKAFVKMMAG